MNLNRLSLTSSTAWLGTWLLGGSLMITENRAEEFRAVTVEAEVPAYSLPDLLEPQAPAGGEAFQQYWAVRRQSLLESFSRHVYG
ncbi:MAG: hypothetical protein ACK53L_10935, partial [Pirellulaceae bacterium]